MPELQTMESPKTAGFVNPNHNNRNRKRIEEEEKEIESLLKGEEEEEEKVEAKEEEEAEETPVSPEERTFKKRYGDLRRHTQQKEKEWEEKFAKLEKLAKQEGIVPPKSDEDLEAWMKEYPDVAGFVQATAAKQAQEMFDKANIRIEELDNERTELKRTSAESVIRKTHSDFDDLRAADEFHDWADAQPKWVKDALYENSDDPQSVIRVIDLYKMDKGLTPADKKKKTKDAAKTVAKNNKTQVDVEDVSSSVKESEVARMSAKEFEERSDEINAALRSGKFIYDISGSAR